MAVGYDQAKAISILKNIPERPWMIGYLWQATTDADHWANT